MQGLFRLHKTGRKNIFFLDNKNHQKHKTLITKALYFHQKTHNKLKTNNLQKTQKSDKNQYFAFFTKLIQSK